MTSTTARRRANEHFGQQEIARRAARSSTATAIRWRRRSTPSTSSSTARSGRTSRSRAQAARLHRADHRSASRTELVNDVRKEKDGLFRAYAGLDFESGRGAARCRRARAARRADDEALLPGGRPGVAAAGVRRARRRADGHRGGLRPRAGGHAGHHLLRAGQHRQPDPRSAREQHRAEAASRAATYG